MDFIESTFKIGNWSKTMGVVAGGSGALVLHFLKYNKPMTPAPSKINHGNKLLNKDFS